MKNISLALVPAGSLLTIGETTYDQAVTDAHNAIAKELNTKVKAGDFIRSEWINVVPTVALADMAVARLRAGLPVPPILAKAIQADANVKKILVVARKEHKKHLIQTQRTQVAMLMDSGFNLSKMDTSAALTPDGKGNRHVTLKLTKGAKAEVSEEDKKAVVSKLSVDELRALLAAKEQSDNTTDIPATPAVVE